jgi:GT2 family glycosyltransferase
MFDEEFKYFCEDIELGYRLAKKGLELKYNEDAKIYDFHPPFFNEYCSRDLKRGYFSVKLLEKHPGTLDISIPETSLKYFCKDLTYPILMRIIDFLDKYLKIPLPFVVYQKILDYYKEKGTRLAGRESGRKSF